MVQRFPTLAARRGYTDSITTAVTRDGWNYFDFKHDLTSDQDATTLDIFVDTTSAPSTTTPVMADNTPSYKYLSGVKYFSNGSTFDLDTVCTGCFANTYRANPIALSATVTITPTTHCPR